MTRVLIADDEAPARRKLARFLEDDASVEIVGEASNGIDAVDLIAITQPDVVFLDVQMPDLDGIGVADALARGASPPAIVFVTAHDRYALAAFDRSAADYLLKPYDRERFDRALERARARAGAAPAGIADLVRRARNEERYARRLLLPREGRSFFLSVGELVRVEADGNDVVLYAASGTFRTRSTMDALEERLDPARFARVHRSHLVNIDAISAIEPGFSGDRIAVLRDGSRVPWSRRYASRRPDLLR